VAEYLVRSVPSRAAGYRPLPRTAIANRTISTLKSTRFLQFVALLTLDDLRRVAQDDWLVTAEECDYVATQEWARWLRALAPEAHGLMWPSALLPGIRLMVLFGDRIPVDSVEPDEPSIELDTPEGTTWLSAVLKPWGIGVSPTVMDQATIDGESRDLLTAREVSAVEADKPAGSPLPDFCIFYKTHLRVVHDIVHAAVLDRELAHDATQDAMFIAYRKWDIVAHHPNPIGYVVTTAKRIAVRVRLRRQRRTFSAHSVSIKDMTIIASP
jgi:RES domain-containing protein/sigma-70-like protein